MLKLPAFKQYEDVTVFQDFNEFWRFYLIPGFPTIREDVNGNPVFLLIKYAFSDQSREENPDLPRGGGYMVFDSELKVSDARRAVVESDLQDYVDAEWERLKNEPNPALRTVSMSVAFRDNINEHWDESGMSGSHGSSTGGTSITIPRPGGPDTPPPPANAPAPKVVIGEPAWTGGTVRMMAPQSTGLVTERVAAQPAALIGNNVAAFNLDLTPDGATFFEKTLLDPGGSGGSDLVPIQVVYELKMLARLPPARAHIRINTSQVYHAVQELTHEHDNGCTDDYFTSESMMTSAIDSGMVSITIDAGGITDEDIITDLMQQAQSTAQQIMSEKFANKDREPLEEWANEDVQTDSREIYRLKQVTDIDMTDFEQLITLNTTIEHQINTQGTMQTFFKGRSASDMSGFVRVVDLDDDFFKTLSLWVRAFANWEQDGIAFVEVHIEYGQGTTLKTQSFTFTKEEQDKKYWDPSLVDGRREYRYRWRVGFQGHPGDDAVWTRWERTTNRNLNVAVETPGKLEVEVTGAGLDFEQVLDVALVHLKYSDPAHGVGTQEHTVVLTKDRLAGTWTRQLFAPWERPLDYKVDYLLKTGRILEGAEWLHTEGPQKGLVIPPPDIDMLDVMLIPSGRWDEVLQSAISLLYEDPGNDYAADGQFLFKAPTEFKQWRVILQDPAVRRFKYKVLTTFKNGDVREHDDWVLRVGDQALPVKALGPRRLDVSVLGAMVNYDITPVVKVNLRYDDPGATPQMQTASFTLQKVDDTPIWSIPIRDDGPDGYRYKVTYYPVEGDAVEEDEVVTTDPAVVVGRYVIPRVGCEVRSTLVDFAATPAVEVNLRYDDPSRDVHEVQTLVFDADGEKSRSWFVPVEDDAPRAYTVEITYHRLDGDPIVLPAVSRDRTSLMIPRWQPPTEG